MNRFIIRIAVLALAVLAAVSVLGGCAGPKAGQEAARSDGSALESEDLSVREQEEPGSAASAPDGDLSMPVSVIETYDDGRLQKTTCKDKAGFQYYGVLDAEGDTILECKYDLVTVISDNRMVAQEGGASWNDGSAWIFDAQGNAISAGLYVSIWFPQLEDGSYAPTGLAEQYKPDGLDGTGFWLVDQDGERVSETVYGTAEYQGGNAFVVTLPDDKDEKQFLVDFSGRRIE